VAFAAFAAFVAFAAFAVLFFFGDEFATTGGADAVDDALDPMYTSLSSHNKLATHD
jgi:hypothetical protein